MEQADKISEIREDQNFKKSPIYSEFEPELSKNKLVEKSKVAEVFALIKDKLAKIIDQYELTIQKVKVKTDLGKK